MEVNERLMVLEQACIGKAAVVRRHFLQARGVPVLEHVVAILLQQRLLADKQEMVGS